MAAEMTEKGSASVEAVTRADCRDEWLGVLAYPALKLDEARRAEAAARFDDLVTLLDGAAGRVDRLMSQIDIPPTLLGMLNFSYTSHFYGYDLFKLEPGRERTFLSTYQELGYMRDGRLTSLIPREPVKEMTPDLQTGDATVAKADPVDAKDAITYYQTAAYLFTHGLMKKKGSAATTAPPPPAAP